MLTREQKIDFLKCCIAAYEDKRVQKRMDSHNLGFCYLFSRLHPSMDPANGLCTYFPKFYKYITINRMHDFNWDWLYMYPLDTSGALKRAQVARQFLKTEYGITVPKRKQLKAKTA